MDAKTCLVLSRKQGESILINDGEIVITVFRISNAKVRLSIQAPAHVKILREELSRKVDHEI